MRYFPLYYDMKQRSVAVIGGGEEAAQKLRLLLKTPAKISIIASTITSEIASMVKSRGLNWIKSAQPISILDRFDLIYIADHKANHEAIVRHAQKLRIPTNVVDQPNHCDFITPAIIDRSPITIAVGSEGTAPVLARMIKTKIEQLLPTNIGKLALKAQSLRKQVANSLTEFNKRRKFWEYFFQGAFSGKDNYSLFDRAQIVLEQCKASNTNQTAGFVSLVGAGPGTSDLLTFKAAQKLQSADVIVYDRLVDKSVLEIARRDAKQIYVGKTPGQKCTSQSTINEILIHEASKGQQVVRLKCGDPFIFGRAGEEMTALQEASIEFDIVPGVTAASACAAEAKLPLTQRKEVRSLTYLTGHSTEGLTPYDWSSLATKGNMLVLYMGVKMAPKIEANLLAVGASSQTKISIIENGCHENSRIFSTNLGKLGQEIKRQNIKNPAIIIIDIEMQSVTAHQEKQLSQIQAV